MQQLLIVSTIEHTAKVKRLRWTGHVIRMLDACPVKAILINNLDSIRRDGEAL